MSNAAESVVFFSRRGAHEHFAGLNDDQINGEMGIAYREAAAVAPEVFYSQAGRSVSVARFGYEGMPTPTAAMDALEDFAYLWRACRTEAGLPITGHGEFEFNDADRRHLIGIRLELLFAACLAGARANGLDMVARFSSAHKDYYGSHDAADLELETSNGNYSLQLKSNGLDSDSLHYDPENVVVISMPLFTPYLGTPGTHPNEQLIPFQLALVNMADLSDRIADGQVDDEYEIVLEESLAYLQVFGHALNKYIEERPDIAAMQRLRAIA